MQKTRPVWIFGAGQFGRDVCEALLAEGYDVAGFVESYPRNSKACGLHVIEWTQLTSHQRKAQLVIGIFNRGMPLDELEHIAKEAGFSDIFFPWDVFGQFADSLGWRYWLSARDLILDNLSSIETAFLVLSDDKSRQCLLDLVLFRLGCNLPYASFRHDDEQYFNDLTLGQHVDGRLVYVDGGAYNGDTLMQLVSKTPIDRAYLFEPDADNFADLLRTVQTLDVPAHCLPLALADHYQILSFNCGSGEGASVDAKGSAHIAAVALDELFNNQHVDFIKLDVEGAEQMALRGARALIERSRPILAISYYHRPADVWELLDQLSDICEDYEFHLRQHHFNSYDSVLYALPHSRI